MPRTTGLYQYHNTERTIMKQTFRQIMQDRKRAALTRAMEHAINQRADADRTIAHLQQQSDRLAVQELDYLITSRRPA